jgi:hypothetical protein
MTLAAAVTAGAARNLIRSRSAVTRANQFAAVEPVGYHPLVIRTQARVCRAIPAQGIAAVGSGGL